MFSDLISFVANVKTIFESLLELINVHKPSFITSFVTLIVTKRLYISVQTMQIIVTELKKTLTMTFGSFRVFTSLVYSSILS